MASIRRNEGRIRPSKAIVRAAFIVGVLGAAGASTAEDLVDTSNVARSAKASELTSTDVNRPVSYAIGDRLKITVFEQLHAKALGQDERLDIVGSVIERPEMSGEYTVHEDGNIYLPLAGAVTVAGQSFHDLDRTLSVALGEKLNGVVRVGIQLKEREPVYIVGSVARPGPYKHVPGMSVLQALALAGAVDSAPQDQWRLLDTMRERERLLRSSERLTRSLARLASLLAEREGAGSVTKRLSELLGPTAAEVRLTEADGFRRVERTKRKEQEAAIESAKRSYQTELEIQNNKLAQVGSNLGDRNLRVDNITKLRERGVTTDVIYYTSLTELGDAKERFQDARTAIAQTEHRISDLQHERQRIGIEADVDREREIRELQTVIDEEELTRAVVGTALAQLPNSPDRRLAGGKETSLSILHRSQAGLERRQALDDTLLEPGDVLQIVHHQPERVAFR